MIRSNFDANLHYMDKGSNIIIFMLYVDDLFIIESGTIIWLK